MKGILEELRSASEELQSASPRAVVCMLSRTADILLKQLRDSFEKFLTFSEFELITFYHLIGNSQHKFLVWLNSWPPLDEITTLFHF